MSRTLTWRVGAWLAIIAVVAGGTACGDSQPPDTASSTSPVGPGTFAAGARDSSTPPAVRRLPERLRAELALFRSSPEGLPIQVKQALRDHSTNGLNWSLAQRVPRAPWRAWIVPGRGVVCLLHVQPQTGAIGQACTATGRLLRDGMFVASLAADPSQADGAFASSRAEPGRRVVFGVVPDRARTVRVHTPGVTPATAQVSENSFALRDETDAPPETITFIR